MHKKVPYITGFLVRFHSFCNVFDSLYSIFHIWIFGKWWVEVDRHRTWLPRNVRNINIFWKNIFVLFVSWWSLHCREKHDVWDCVNEDLETKAEDDSCWSVGLCYSCSCVLNKDKPLPSQIASRAGSATDSLSHYVTAHALVTLGLLSASCPGAEGVTHTFSESHFPCCTPNIHTCSGKRCRGADPQPAWADRALAISSNLKHMPTNLTGRMCYKETPLATSVWFHYYECLLYRQGRFTVNSFGVTETCCQSNVKSMQHFLMKFSFCRDCLCCRGNPV